jgi:hypothetical protein
MKKPDFINFYPAQSQNILNFTLEKFECIMIEIPIQKASNNWLK